MDGVGNLWVQEYDVPGASTVVWSVFDPNARWITDVRIPHAVTIHDIGDDWVLLLARDEMDVERIRLHKLVKKRD